VLKLVSQEFIPVEGSYRGEEKWVFQAVGEGEIDLRLWYTGQRRDTFGTDPVFSCVVAVGNLSPVAKGPDDKDMKPARVHRKPPRKAPKAPKTAPADESAPFSEPVFRSSRVPLRDQHDRGQQQS
jgi:hypothetical protein